MTENAKNQTGWLTATTVLFLACTLAMLFFIDPEQAPWYLILLFYFCLFALVAGFLTLVIYALRRKALARNQDMSTSLREGTLLSILATGSLALSSQGSLHWWIALMFVITIVLIEGYFLA